MLKFKSLTVALCSLVAAVHATDIAVPNFSFETPTVPDGTPAYPVLVNWQQTPKRPDYVENPPFTWNVLAGVFPNSAAGQPDHIDNINGNQAAYLFAEGQNGIFQDLDAKYDIGSSVDLTVGLLASPNIPPTAGSPITISLYYRDNANAMVSIATKTVTYSTTTFPNGTHLIDFNLHVPAVASGSAWAGKNVGILVESGATEQNKGGVWDIDNVRLTATREFVDVPNFSFELPPVPAGAPAYPVIDSWQKLPQPSYWDEQTMGAWDNLTGVFPNPAQGEQGHIDNANGAQAAYLFATPGSGIYQDLPVQFEAGATYRVTVGVVGSTAIPPTANTPLSIVLYYHDELNNQVPIAQQSVVYNAQNFPTATVFRDFSATSRGVNSTTPWLGRTMGILIASGADNTNSGGVWDIDNVRLTVYHGVTLRYKVEGTNLRISWNSTEGTQYQLYTGEEVSSQFPTLAATGDVLNGTGGEMSVSVPMTGQTAFFEVRAAIP